MYKALDESVSCSAKLAGVSDFAFRVWACGLARADIVGRIDAIAVQFRALCVPLAPQGVAEVEAALQELVGAGLLHLYESRGHRYGVYHDHGAYNPSLGNLANQRSRCPEPPGDLCPCIRLLRAPSPLPTPEKRGEDRRGEDRDGSRTVPRPSNGRSTVDPLPKLTF